MNQQEIKDMAKYFYRASAADFMKIPGSPVAYWLPATGGGIFEISKSIGGVSSPRQGMATTSDEKFLRLWFEVNVDKVSFKSPSNEQAKDSRKKWFPFLKGGDFRKWYGNNQYLVNFENNGEEVCAYIDNTPGARVKSNGRVINRAFYFKKALTWTLISSTSTAFRFCSEGFVLGHKGPAIYGDDRSLDKIGAYLNSKVSPYYLKVLAPTIGFEVGQISKLPFIDIDVTSERAVEIAREDWDSYELSWDFGCNELIILKVNKDLISGSYFRAKEKWKSLTNELRNFEEKNNDKIIPAYGLESELDSDVPIGEVTLSRNPYYQFGAHKSVEELDALFQSDAIAELISYGIGCMMGRYSLDKFGLILASQGETLQDYLALTPSPSFAPDENAILPLSDQEWFLDDVTNRFSEFIRTVWGAENLQENLDFVAESLCLQAVKAKSGESALDTIRRYLSTQFYKDHLRTYKKRPIYWLFSSGKHKAFECLVYLHRYNESTLARMRTEYVIPLSAKLNTYADKLEQDIDASTSTAETKRLEKEVATLHKQQIELAEFDEKLRHYADQRISLNLDDGVKINYGKFGNLLAETKAVTGNKEALL